MSLKIVTEDFYFDKAVELKSALEEEFQEDDRKIYEIIENKSLEEKRKSKEGISIPGCRKARMISIFPDGMLKGECYLEGYTLEKNERNERSNFV